MYEVIIVEMLNKDMLMIRDKEVLGQVQEKLRNIVQQYVFDEKDVFQRKTKDAIDRILKQNRASLDTYGLIHETDKASIIVKNGKMGLPHDYLRHYERFLQELRDKEITVIEFGCYEGASLRLWEDYFPKATIYGVDIVPDVQKYVTDRINIVIGNAAYQDTYDAIEQDMNGKQPYVIIDDASHAWSEQRITLMNFWKMLAPGGIYIIEDLECGTQGAYPEYKPAIDDPQPFFNFIQDRCQVLRWPVGKEGFEERTHHQLPAIIQTFEEELDMCTFIPGAVILRKKG